MLDHLPVFLDVLQLMQVVEEENMELRVLTDKMELVLITFFKM